MNETVFTGVCTALVTPFLNGQVNYPMIEQILRRQIASGITSVVLCGTTGESPTLTDVEKLEIFSRGKACAGDLCKIIAGTGSNSTEHAITLSKQAEKAGADALLVVSPYYNKANADGLYTHYASIANSVSIPVILYNVPSRTGVDIPVSVYKQLSVIPNIAGVKEASTDIGKIARIRADCPDSFYIWSGNDDLTIPVIALGGQGVISVLSNVLPDQMRLLTELSLAGRFSDAVRLQKKLQALMDLMFCDVNPIPVKAAMKHIGFDCGDCRLPLTNLNRKNKEKLKALLS